jgi:L-2,4-diaminobutyrate decarboxylase
MLEMWMRHDRSDVIEDPYSAEAFRRDGHAVVDLLAEYLAATAGGRGKVLAYRSAAEMLERWPATFHNAQGPSLVELLPRVLEDSHHLHHPGYVGHQVSAPLPVSALAELVAALLNNGMAEYEMGPAANALEKRLIDWFGKMLGFPPEIGGMLTSGGSVGNLTALAAARQTIDGLDLWNTGLAGAPKLSILVSDQAHYSIDRAARILGLGAAGVQQVGTDGRFRLDPRALDDAHQRAEAAGRRVFAVVGSACSTVTGAFDPLVAIADYAEEHSLWFHVDAAHGGAAALSSRYRSLLDGIERADSVVIDAHKMLQMPALVTAVLFRGPEWSSRAFQQEQSYVGFQSAGDEYPWWDSGLRTLECTKRMMSLELYASVMQHGTEAFSAHVEQTFELARRFADVISAEPDFELATEPQANIVCFRHVPGGERDLDLLQLQIREAIVHAGDFYIVKTRLPAGLYLRATIMNARTTEDDLRTLLRRIRQIVI